MMNLPDSLFGVLTFLTAVTCALNAGLFFIFSNTIMTALGRITPSQGIAAMQSINSAILNPWFIVAFFGTALLCIALIVLVLIGRGDNGTGFVIAGSVIFLAGCIGVTAVVNVPMNNALDAVDPDDAESITVWTDYLIRWTNWNHIRTAASIASTALFILALYQQP